MLLAARMGVGEPRHPMKAKGPATSTALHAKAVLNSFNSGTAPGCGLERARTCMTQRHLAWNLLDLLPLLLVPSWPALHATTRRTHSPAMHQTGPRQHARGGHAPRAWLEIGGACSRRRGNPLFCWLAWLARLLCWGVARIWVRSTGPGRPGTTHTACGCNQW